MSASNTPQHNHPQAWGATPLPWYAHCVIGLTLTGFVPWCFVVWNLLARGRRRAALFLFLPLIALLVLYGWFVSHARIDWVSLALIEFGFHLVVSLGAWVTQNRMIQEEKWRQSLAVSARISPLIAGILVGLSVAVLFSMTRTMVVTGRMMRADVPLDRHIVAVSFLTYAGLGVLGGVLLGAWWSRLGKHFTILHPVSLVCSVLVSMGILVLVMKLELFISHRGSLPDLSSWNSWRLTSPVLTGLPGVVDSAVLWLSFTAIVVIGLCVGSPRRIRDFWFRVTGLSLLVVAVSLPLAGSSVQWWSSHQDQILFDCDSPRESERRRALAQCDVMLARFPNHAYWPWLAEQRARGAWEHGNRERALDCYAQIVGRFAGSKQWHASVRRAGEVLAAARNSVTNSGRKLTIPMVDWEQYMGEGWMSLLVVMNYWHKDSIPESALKMNLKQLSLTRHDITIGSMTSPVDFHWAATTLGYNLLFFPCSAGAITACIDRGIPVLRMTIGGFSVIYGYDNERSVFYDYSFDRLSERLCSQARKEAGVILDKGTEHEGEAARRRKRIEREARGEEAMSLLDAPLRQGYPWAAALVPAGGDSSVARALMVHPDTLRRRSNASLQTYIALGCIGAGDPEAGVYHAGRAAVLTDEPYPFYAGHIAHLQWRRRSTKIGSSLPLRNRFPVLDSVHLFFQRSTTHEFLDTASHIFNRDLQTGIVPERILSLYQSMLSAYDPHEAASLRRIAHIRLQRSPWWSAGWSHLARTCDIDGDTAALITALRGRIETSPTDDDARVKLASVFVLRNEFDSARILLKQVHIDSVQTSADYFFSKAAVARHDTNTSQAWRAIKKALDLCRYRPYYHVLYARLLIEADRTDEARKEVQWARTITTDSGFRNDMQQILDTLGTQTAGDNE